MAVRILVASAVLGAALLMACPASTQKVAIDPNEVQNLLCRFPLAQVVSLEGEGGWGVMYADTYGKLHLLRATERGWKLEWEVTNLGAKVRKFFFCDLEGNGSLEFVVATTSGRILSYSMDDYTNLWENLEDRYQEISAIDIADVDADPQLELIYLADKYLYIYDGVSKSRQWMSPRAFAATEMLVANVDKDAQPEIILNSGIIIDSRFLNIEVEWEKAFGERIAVVDMNSDGYPEIVGEFGDYSIRVFDVYARREVW